MTDKPLHAEIVTAVMDCIEREGMISRGKLEQAVAGVLATRQDKAWATVGDPHTRIDHNGRAMGLDVGGPDRSVSVGIVKIDGDLVRVPVGGDWLVSPDNGLRLPEVKFNHKTTDKPISVDRTSEAGENRNSVPSPSWVTEQQLRTFSLAPDFFTQDKKA
jgi:hypothetical protein